MDCIDVIFERANLQQICCFLMNGVERIETNTEGHKERLEKLDNKMSDYIESMFKDSENLDDIRDKILCYTSACQDLYMEIGLICGLKIATEVMGILRPKTDD